MKTNSKTLKAVCVAVVVVLASSPGSAGAWEMPKFMRLDNTWPFRDKDKPQEGTPVRMVGSWTDTVMTQPGQKPQRAFGGRIIFYDKEGKKPILVDGQLVVYAFDETNRESTDNKPTRRYVFPADQMSIHMSKCDMGASYSFWLPWDEAGGPKTEVGLICRFEPKGGGVVTGEQTHHLLPGPLVAPGSTASARYKPPAVPEGVPSKPAKETLEDMQAARNAMQQQQLARQTGYEAMTPGVPQGAVVNTALQAGAAPDRRLMSTTIALPQNFQMPETAAAMQAANYQQQPVQMTPQMLPANMQPQLQPTPGRVYGAAPQVMAQQAITNGQPYATAQMPQQQGPQQVQQMPAAAQTTYPGMQAIAQLPVGGTPPAGQIQQQAYQQPIIQHPMMQPPPIRQQLPAMQPWQQSQGQGQPATATLNSPAQVMYH